MKRMNEQHVWPGLLLCFCLLATACGGGSSRKKVVAAGDPAEPAYSEVTFTAEIDNPYLPLTPGTSFVFEGETDEGEERIEIFVSHVTRTVDGVECTVVIDRAFVDDELVEETADWFAQDNHGNVWYFGEDSREIENGVVVSTEGSWEAGVDGAEAGIVMKAVQVVGDSYRQEYYEGEAEDMAEVVALGVRVTLDDGSVLDCLKTREWTPLEPGADEYKYYAMGIGLVREEPTDGSEHSDLAGNGDDMMPEIDPNGFSTVIDNPYFPLTPGMVATYEGETEEGDEEVIVTVLATTKTVMGVECVVVEDRALVDGELVELTYDWYAQDEDGNVWYFGEDSAEYEDGEVVSTDGSWESGVDGAQPGIIMKAEPRVWDVYRQEYYAGEAEDMAEVVALNVPVQLEDGSSHVCLQTREWNPLEEDSEEYKYFAPGIGLVKESDLEGENALELTDLSSN